MNQVKVQKNRQARKVRVRHQVLGTADRPRLHVFRSNRFLCAQIIADDQGRTLASAYERELTEATGTKTERATALGQLIAKKAKKANITKVSFDRGYYKYHGRIKALAEAARAEGLEF
jgi:large subunit ribosomal protein L18